MANSSTLDEVPLEVLTKVFEIGVLVWGVKYLAPLCLVCKAWNDIITNTPHLWGIIEIDGRKKQEFLLHQLAMAKETPLTLKTDVIPHFYTEFVEKLAELQCNWVSAELDGRRVCSMWPQFRWVKLRQSLKELTFLSSLSSRGIINFFNGASLDMPDDPALEFLSLRGQINDIIYFFLSPSLKSLYLRYTRNSDQIPLSNTLNQLSKTPNLEELDLVNLHHLPQLSYENESDVTRLNKLVYLNLQHLNYPSVLLNSLSCPSLQTFFIIHRISSNDSSLATLGPFLSQWSKPQFIPDSLHTLHIEEGLSYSHMPSFIHFLSHLPLLANLKLFGEELKERGGNSSDWTNENDLFKALASPKDAPSGGLTWLCPSLAAIDVNFKIDGEDLLRLAELRGCNSSKSSSNAPKSLEMLSGKICPGDVDELNRLLQLVECTCWNCRVTDSYIV